VSRQDKLYRDRGIILRSIRLGETDRIITFFGEQSGKVRAVAKGVRKSSSKFGGKLEPLSEVALQLHRGRDLDVVTQVETIQSHRALREDLDLLTRAAIMLESVDRLSIDRTPDGALAQLISKALIALEESGSLYTSTAFVLKALSLAGAAPSLDSCVRCGALIDGSAGYDESHGGLSCDNCRGGSLQLDSASVAVARAMVSGGLAQVLAMPLDHHILGQLDAFSTRAIEMHCETRFRSVRAVY
jgi:DNA repair protein RecO (recombination protein O)